MEPWAGYYFNTTDNAARTNYALRQAVRDEKAANPGGTTAVSCCGANPGMVSWFVKEGLLTLACDTGHDATPPTDRAGWAQLNAIARCAGRAHRPTRTRRPAACRGPRGRFREHMVGRGFIAEGFQPAELGWGTHEPWFPENGHRHENRLPVGDLAGAPGAHHPRAQLGAPTPGPQFGFLVTHNEAISISDYYIRGAGGRAGSIGRPATTPITPCDDAVLSLHEMFGSGRTQEKPPQFLSEDEIARASTTLGGAASTVLREENALWSRPAACRTRRRATLAHLTQNRERGYRSPARVLAVMRTGPWRTRCGIVEARRG